MLKLPFGMNVLSDPGRLRSFGRAGRPSERVVMLSGSHGRALNTLESESAIVIVVQNSFSDLELSL